MASVILKYWQFQTNIFTDYRTYWSSRHDPAQLTKAHFKVSLEPGGNGTNGTDYFLSTAENSLPQVWRVNYKNVWDSDNKIRIKVNNLNKYGPLIFLQNSTFCYILC
jgi:hypothetical protein